MIDTRLSPTPVYSFIGYQKEVNVACVFSGYPTPLVKMVNTSSGEEVAQGNRSASFEITTDLDNDFGTFNCTAENLLGMNHFTVELKVAGMLHSGVSYSNEQLFFYNNFPWSVLCTLVDYRSELKVLKNSSGTTSHR